METLDAGSRQSAALPSFHRLDLEKLKRESAEHYQKHPSVAALNMTTAPLVSPTMYTGPPPPYSYPSSTTSSVTGIVGLVSPPDSRRTSENDKEPPATQKHSLPSIHEALAADQSISYTAPPSAPALSSQSHPSAPLLTPTTPIPRSHPTTSPQGPPNPFSHGQPLGLYSSQTYQARNSQPQQSAFAPSECNHSTTKSYESKFEHIQPTRPGQSYTAPSEMPNLSQPQTSSTYHPGRSPPGPMISQTQNGYKPYQPSYTFQPQPSSMAPSPYHRPESYHALNSHPTTWRSDGSEINRAEEGRKAASKGVSLGGQSYGESVKRHLDIFEIETSLNEIAEGSGRMLDFSRHYSAHAHQTQRSGPIPGSLPSLAECDEMLRQHNRVHESFTRIRDVILTQQLALAEQRAHEQGYKGSSEYDEDGAGYQDEFKAGGGFAGADAKKRRGRAAPPGRCHSCNRAETPEWRRGPDGARTLCNACGLHYAKLTRKMGSKASAGVPNLRPKSMGPNSLPC